MRTNKVSTLKLQVNFRKEAKSVIAYSPALDISTVGKDEQEARKNFEELVSMFLSDILERGVLDEVLSDLGWTKLIARPSKQSQISNWSPPEIKQESIQIPIPVTA